MGGDSDAVRAGVTLVRPSICTETRCAPALFGSALQQRILFLARIERAAKDSVVACELYWGEERDVSDIM